MQSAVDEVFAGDTEKTLGYTTIPVQGKKGKDIRIELTGTHSDKDGYEFDELDPAKQAAEIAARQNEGRGMLGIIEIEVYENVNPNKDRNLNYE